MKRAGNSRAALSGQGAAESGQKATPRMRRGLTWFGILLAPVTGRRNPLVRVAILLFDGVVLVALALFLAVLLAPGRELPAPDWLADRIEARVEGGLGGGSLTIGGVALSLADPGLPRAVLRDVSVVDEAGRTIADVPRISVSIAKGRLLRGRLEPRDLGVSGPSLVIRRDRDGRFDFGFGALGTGEARFGSIAEAMSAVDDFLELPSLAGIETVSIDNVTARLEDARAGRIWEGRGGTVTVTQGEQDLTIDAALRIAEARGGKDAPGGDGIWPEPSRVAVNITKRKGEPAASISATVDDLPAQGLAAQSPALAFLAPLSAPVSGSLLANIGGDGLGALYTTLELGAGSLVPGSGADPVAFDGARAYLRYEPTEQKLIFDELSVTAPALDIAASGHAYMSSARDDGDAWPDTLVAQLAFSDLRLDPEGLMAQPALFDEGALDVKVSLDPLRVEVGQAVLSREGALTRLVATGRAEAGPDGWDAAVDLSVDEIGADDLLALWPLDAVARTRSWVDERVRSGTLSNARAAIRIAPEERPVISLGWEFRDAVVQPLDTLPPITGAEGYATMTGDTYSMSLDAGEVVAPEGGSIDVAGSVFRIPDIRQRPATGEILWRSTSPLTATLSLLDQKPFEVMTKANRPVDIATGTAILEGTIRTPLRKGVQPDEVEWRMEGRLSGLSSGKIVEGKTLTAETLTLDASNDAIVIGGPGTLDGVPLTARWRQPLGPPETRGPGTVTGSVEISPRTIETFNIGLPPGTVTGSGTGELTLTLGKGTPPEFRLTSQLRGVGLSVPQIGWSKAPATAADLAVTGSLGKPPRVDRLVLDAPGLEATGAVTLKAGGGGLDRAVFSRIATGGWLDAAVTLRGRGRGVPPSLVLTGGTVDLRELPDGLGGEGGGSGGPGVPLSVSLDRLVVSGGISLTGVNGDLLLGDGVNGRITGSVNGAAPVAGLIGKTASGQQAVRVTSGDAGAVLRAAGLFRRALGGDLSLTLVSAGGPGRFDGTAIVQGTRVQGAPGLVALLNTISVVGLIEQVNGPGLLMDDVRAEFRLVPGAVEIERMSGTGPSIGISAAGVYDISRDRLAIQGVFSPIYAVNGIGQIISRPGEGLIGVNYSLRGPSSAPEISVNPLSVLTPGIFREIFRADPPRLARPGETQ